MRYRKIAIKKDNVDIEYEDSNAAGTFDVMSLKAKDEPAPEFHKAMDDFKPIFIRLCELNKLDEGKIVVTGVHLSYHGDNNRMGIVISGYKKLVNYVGIVTMNSPCMLEREDKANPKKDIPDDLSECFEELWKQADKFLKGYRAQTKIDFSANKDTPEKPTKGKPKSEKKEKVSKATGTVPVSQLPETEKKKGITATDANNKPVAEFKPQPKKKASKGEKKEAK
jgi:hypothetical protein